MQLSAYLKHHGLTEAGFADLIGSTQQTVNRLCRGTVPRQETLERIVAATGGAVGWEDFNPLRRQSTPGTPREAA